MVKPIPIFVISCILTSCSIAENHRVGQNEEALSKDDHNQKEVIIVETSPVTTLRPEIYADKDEPAGEDLRAIPYYLEGKQLGMRVFAIKAQSEWEKYGLENGDVITSIDQHPTKEESDIKAIANLLRENNSVTLIIRRNLDERKMTIRIKQQVGNK